MRQKSYLYRKLKGEIVNRYYIDFEKNKLIDREKELSSISLDDKVDFHELCKYLNAKEMEKLQYKKQYNNLRFKIKKLSESI